MNPICPYCRTEVGEAEGERKDCPGCGTPHHADCFAENGGCTVFGCANAPSDEAKVTVSGTDLMGNTVTRQAPAPTPTPVIRPGLTLGSGFTTFRAPAVSVAQPAPVTAPGGNGVAPPHSATSSDRGNRNCAAAAGWAGSASRSRRRARWRITIQSRGRKRE